MMIGSLDSPLYPLDMSNCTFIDRFYTNLKKT